MPVQTRVLDALGGILPHGGADRDDQQHGDARRDVHPMEAGDDKKAGAELGNPPGVAREPGALVDEVSPLVDLHSRKAAPPRIVNHKNIVTCFLLPTVAAATAQAMVALLVMSVKVINVM